MNLIIQIINATVAVLSLLIFIYSLLNLILSPYHPVRQILGKIIEPLLAPIRKAIPPVGGLDFSPLILIIVLQVVGMLIIAILRGFS